MNKIGEPAVAERSVGIQARSKIQKAAASEPGESCERQFALRILGINHQGIFYGEPVNVRGGLPRHADVSVKFFVHFADLERSLLVCHSQGQAERAGPVEHEPSATPDEFIDVFVLFRRKPFCGGLGNCHDGFFVDGRGAEILPFAGAHSEAVDAKRLRVTLLVVPVCLAQSVVPEHHDLRLSECGRLRSLACKPLFQPGGNRLPERGLRSLFLWTDFGNAFHDQDRVGRHHAGVGDRGIQWPIGVRFAGDPPGGVHEEAPQVAAVDREIHGVRISLDQPVVHLDAAVVVVD